jgi:hypothetical protein
MQKGIQIHPLLWECSKTDMETNKNTEIEAIVGAAALNRNWFSSGGWHLSLGTRTKPE